VPFVCNETHELGEELVSVADCTVKGDDFLHVAFTVTRPFTTIGPSEVVGWKSTDRKYLCCAVGTVTDVCLQQSKVGASAMAFSGTAG